MSELSRHFDRFRLESFTIYQRVLHVETEYLDRRVAQLLRGSIVNQDMNHGERAGQSAVPLRIHLEVSTCAVVSRTLLDLDVELRRTAEFLTKGGTRPTGDSHVIEVLEATRSSSINVELLCGSEIYTLLTLRPLAFLQTLDWFWRHRHTRMKVRIPNEVIDPTYAWAEMLRSTNELTQLGHAVVVAIDVASDGTTKFGFAAFPSGTPV